MIERQVTRVLTIKACTKNSSSDKSPVTISFSIKIAPGLSHKRFVNEEKPSSTAAVKKIWALDSSNSCY